PLRTRRPAAPRPAVRPRRGDAARRFGQSLLASVPLEQVAEHDPAGLDRLRQCNRMARHRWVLGEVALSVLAVLEEVEHVAAAAEARPVAASAACEDDRFLWLPPSALGRVEPHPDLAARQAVA